MCGGIIKVPIHLLKSSVEKDHFWVDMFWVDNKTDKTQVTFTLWVSLETA